MKRLLVITLSALIVLCCCPVTGVFAAEFVGTAEISLAGNSTTFNIGDTAVYTVELTTVNTVANGQLVLNYSESVLTVKEAHFPVVGDGLMMCNYNKNVTDQIRFSFSEKNGIDFTDGGILAQISFEVTSPGECELVLDKIIMSHLTSNYKLVDELPNSVFIESLSGSTAEPETVPTIPSDTEETTADTEETSAAAEETAATEATSGLTEPATSSETPGSSETTEPATDPAETEETSEAVQVTEPVTETPSSVDVTEPVKETEPSSSAYTEPVTQATEPVTASEKPTELKEQRVDISKCAVTCKSSVVYNGKAQKPAVTVKNGGVKLSSSDYSVSYKNNINVGKASVTIKGRGAYSGTKAVSFVISKADNTAKITYASKTVKYSKLKKAKQYANPVTVKNPKGKVVYKKLSGSSALSVSSAGKVAVKKGTKKGKYTLKIKVTVKGNSNYKSTSKTVKCTITVK